MHIHMTRRGAAILMVLIPVACGGDHLTASGTDDQIVRASLSTIPPHFTMTPAGLRRTACIHEIPNGAAIDENNNVSISGKIIDHIPSCDNDLIPPSAPVRWVMADWADATTINGLTYFNEVEVTSYVPDMPRNNDNQLIYFFPGATLNGATHALIQPVLQWGNNNSFGGPFWTLTSWYIPPTGPGVHTTPLNVAPGDQIFNEMRMDDHHTGFDFWLVAAYDYRLAQWASGAYTTAAGIGQSVQRGVLEAYASGGLTYPTSCNDYPEVGDTDFVDVAYYQAGPAWNNHNLVNPAFAPKLPPTFGSPSPNCQFNITYPVAGDANFYFGN